MPRPVSPFRAVEPGANFFVAFVISWSKLNNLMARRRILIIDRNEQFTIELSVTDNLSGVDGASLGAQVGGRAMEPLDPTGSSTFTSFGVFGAGSCGCKSPATF